MTENSCGAREKGKKLWVPGCRAGHPPILWQKGAMKASVLGETQADRCADKRVSSSRELPRAAICTSVSHMASNSHKVSVTCVTHGLASHKITRCYLYCSTQLQGHTNPDI